MQPFIAVKAVERDSDKDKWSRAEAFLVLFDFDSMLIDFKSVDFKIE